MRFCFGLTATALTIFLIAVTVDTGAAQSTRDLKQHFSRKPITVIVGTAPGGGYDTFARIVARFAGKYLPGNPSFLVQNIPGGGQLRGLRATMKARPDGLTIGTLHPRFIMRELTGDDVPDFDIKTVGVLGSPSAIRVPRLFCVRRSLASSWQELEKLGRPITGGDSAPGSAFGLGPQFVEALGGPIKMVYGYGGTSDIMAAFDRGELESTNRCTVENVPRLFPNWIKNKTVAPVWWWDKKPTDDWLGQLGAKDVPYILDVIKTNESQRNAYEVTSQLHVFNRIFVTPPNLPKDVIAAWRDAFEKTTKDAGFLKAAAAAGLDVGLGTAEDFRKSLDAYEKLTAEGKKLFKVLIGS